jgi:hypothetical protein
MGIDINYSEFSLPRRLLFEETQPPHSPDWAFPWKQESRAIRTFLDTRLRGHDEEIESTP